MNKITYNGETYQPSQFWPLVRALQKDGNCIRILCECDGRCAVDAQLKNNLGEVFFTMNYSARSPFLALYGMVEEIKKHEAAK